MIKQNLKHWWDMPGLALDLLLSHWFTNCSLVLHLLDHHVVHLGFYMMQ
jgi:hypothetical protein